MALNAFNEHLRRHALNNGSLVEIFSLLYQGKKARDLTESASLGPTLPSIIRTLPSATEPKAERGGTGNVKHGCVSDGE